MRTTAKALAMRTTTRRRRRRLVDEIVAASQRADWRRVEAAAAEVGDPDAMELAGVIAVLSAHLFARAVELRDDCEATS